MSHAASPGHDCLASCPLASAGRPQGGVPQASGVDRRTFLSQAVLASAYAAATAALAACGSGGSGDSATAPPSISSNVITVASYPALANVGGVQTVTYDGTPLAIVRSQWVGGQRTSSMGSYSATYDAAAGTLTIG